MTVKITGLDAVTRQLDELSKAMKELDGEVAMVKFDPEDPASIERAIQRFNDAVDEKVVAYRANKAVMSIVEQLKETGRADILQRAAKARIQSEAVDDN